MIEHHEGAGIGRLARHWQGVLDLDVRRPATGAAQDALPTDLSGHDALVVLGGRMAAWEDEIAPHLPAVRALLASAVGDGLPTLGICLGAQLLALATGGRVERGAAGTEAGLVTVSPAPEARGDALLGRLAREFTAAESHGDAVTALPPRALLLASSATYAVQAFRVGERAWGVQYHPEATAADFGLWMDQASSGLAACGSDPQAQRAAASARDDDLEALAAAHAHAFAAVVAGSRGAGSTGAGSTGSSPP